MFPNFLGFLRFSDRLVHQINDTRYQVSFYLWRTISVIEVPKYYDQDYRKSLKSNLCRQIFIKT